MEGLQLANLLCNLLIPIVMTDLNMIGNLKKWIYHHFCNAQERHLKLVTCKLTSF